MAFLELARECLAATDTTLRTWKFFRRIQRAFVLARYVEYSASLPGARIECGVYKGFSALLACKVLKRKRPAFDGDGFFLCDSFEGLSPPDAEDSIEVDTPGHARELRPAHAQGHFAVDLATVARRFAEYPRLGFAKGFIPEVLAVLPDRRWSYVHIDVDLYAPTRSCLEYFVPRMERGGVILNDDFSSALFPGAGKAWREFMDTRDLPYVVLDTGQSVFVAL